MKAHYLIALGATLPSPAGPPQTTLDHALWLIAEGGDHVIAQSRWYETPAFPMPTDPPYINGVALVGSFKTTQAFLAALQQVEAALGRVREKRWSARTIDLDLIAAGDAVLPDRATQERWRDLSQADQTEDWPSELIVPHPSMQDRAIGLVPLVEIAPDWHHPTLGKTAAELLGGLPQADIEAVVPFEPAAPETA